MPDDPAPEPAAPVVSDGGDGGDSGMGELGVALAVGLMLGLWFL